MTRNWIAIVGVGALVSGCGVWDRLVDKDESDDAVPPECASVLCGPCAPALTVRFTGEAGKPALDMTLSTSELDCSSDGPRATCTTTNNHAGIYEFDATAPGYEPEHVRVEISMEEDELPLPARCCATCGYVPQVVDVTLTPTRG